MSPAWPIAARFTSTLTTTAGENSLAIPSLNTSFSYQWLRDSCQCPSCVHPSTRQKLHRTSDIPYNVAPAKEGVRAGQDGVHIKWTSGHTSFYPSTFLERYASSERLNTFHKDVHKQSWDAKLISQSSDLFLSYGSLRSDVGLLDAITQLSKYGLLFLSGVPNTETSDERCEVRRVADTFGQLRSTFYGETWDVKNIVNSRNIAYTNLFLGLHTDLSYVPLPFLRVGTVSIRFITSVPHTVLSNSFLRFACPCLANFSAAYHLGTSNIRHGIKSSTVFATGSREAHPSSSILSMQQKLFDRLTQLLSRS